MKPDPIKACRNCQKEIACGNRKLNRYNTLQFCSYECCCEFRKVNGFKNTQTHGLSTSKQYHAWRNMKARCTDPNNIEYEHYGGRGINYEPKWETFLGFWEDMETGYAEGLSIERKDVNANYSKANCTWIPLGHQQRNKTNSRLITYKDETLCLSEWAERMGMKVHTLYRRIAIMHMPVEEALTTSVRLWKIK